MIKESYDLIQFKFNIYKLQENNTKYRNHKVPKYKKSNDSSNRARFTNMVSVFYQPCTFSVIRLGSAKRKLHAAKDGYFTGQIPSQNTAKPEITGDFN